MKKVIVVGAAGVLGQLVCSELLTIFDRQIRLIVTDYKIERGEKLKIVTLSALFDYHTTAMATASLAKIAQQKSVKGVVYPFEITDIDELLSEINCPNIIIGEFEK